MYACDSNISDFYYNVLVYYQQVYAYEYTLAIWFRSRSKLVQMSTYQTAWMRMRYVDTRRLIWIKVARKTYTGRYREDKS